MNGANSLKTAKLRTASFRSEGFGDPRGSSPGLDGLDEGAARAEIVLGHALEACRHLGSSDLRGSTRALDRHDTAAGGLGQLDVPRTRFAVEPVCSLPDGYAPEHIRTGPVPIPLSGQSKGLEVDLVGHDAAGFEPSRHFGVNARKIRGIFQDALRQDEINASRRDGGRVPGNVVAHQAVPGRL